MIDLEATLARYRSWDYDHLATAGIRVAKRIERDVEVGACRAADEGKAYLRLIDQVLKEKETACIL